MIWPAVAGSAAVTYLVRVVAFEVALPARVPRSVARYVDALPAAIIAALVGPTILVHGRSVTAGPELVAAAAVIAIVAWRRNLLAGVLAGVAVVALLRLVLSS
ncbi:MAG TPA: AzlD domain-containing protein [Candidatus Limnocylindria bacterium]|nr:AzlD domain-containing protein [Candidatus Limnocylindria bacterium]